jgi:hypothetical protein
VKKGTGLSTAATRGGEKKRHRKRTILNINNKVKKFSFNYTVLLLIMLADYVARRWFRTTTAV